MKCKVLKNFKGSNDGRFSVLFEKGEEVELSEELAAVAVKEGWVEELKGNKSKKDEKVVYSKMNVADLKKELITRGVREEDMPSDAKKKDLIEGLEKMDADKE